MGALTGNVESTSKTNFSEPMPSEVKECLHKHVNKNALLKINQHIIHWKRLARCLGMDEATITRIHNDYSLDGDAECCYQMLLCWNKSGAKQTFKTLVNALEEANEDQAIDFVRKNLCDITI